MAARRIALAAAARCGIIYLFTRRSDGQGGKTTRLAVTESFKAPCTTHDAGCRCSYDFDDIGNRESSSERGTNSVYASNNLNQYSAVDDFTPQFDDDGNQTLIKTATGIWQVQYNGEDRPVLWTCTQPVNPSIGQSDNQTISMSYDRMGRRLNKCLHLPRFHTSGMARPC